MICKILNPTSVWVLLWILSASIIVLTKKTGVSSAARWFCMCAPFYSKWLLEWLSCNCLQYAISLPYRESRLSLNGMSSSQCNFITIKLPVSAKHNLARKQRSIIVPLTLSATQLHVSEKKYVLLAVNNLHPNYWANVGNFYFLGTVVWQQSNIVQQGVFCFQTSFGCKNKICAEQKNLCFCVQNVCNVHRRRVVACWLFCIQKNVILAVLLLMLTTQWHKS